jgi:hypothetical protein
LSDQTHPHWYITDVKGQKLPMSSFLPVIPSPSNRNPNHAPTATGAPSSHSTALPSVIDLTARIAEANTSATLLQQLLQSTPLSEVTENDLIKEFVDRCKLAQKSVQTYINADPPADEDTLTTLIETNDLLRLALERHRAMVKEVVEKREEPVSGEARVGVVGEGVPAGVGHHVMHGMHGAGTVGEATHGAEDLDVSPVSPLVSFLSVNGDEVPPTEDIYRAVFGTLTPAGGVSVLGESEDCKMAGR